MVDCRLQIQIADGRFNRQSICNLPSAIRRVRLMRASLSVVVLFLAASIQAQTPTVTAIRAGRLLDPEAGRILTNQVILVEVNKITDVGPSVAIPAGAQVIDLSRMTVMP